MLENLANKLCSLLSTREKGAAREWKLLGQEQDGCLLFTWVHTLPDDHKSQSRIGIYYPSTETFQIVYSFNKTVNTVQASINTDKSLLAFVIKDNEDTDKDIYKPFIVEISKDANKDLISFNTERSKQIMVQFLYRQSKRIEDESAPDKLLLFVHHECITLRTISRNVKQSDGNQWKLSTDSIHTESLVRSFVWAQWDCVQQSLFYIHYRKPSKCVVDEEDRQQNDRNCNLSPTLSGLQFHDNLPHETVLNIPLNLPQLPNPHDKACGVYEDDIIPLRVHDCSLDLLVISEPKGKVCICHHYLYQPVQGIGGQGRCHDQLDPTTNVHLAYSVTLLHHGCVLHCSVPGVPWDQARTIRPTFIYHGEHHLLVFVPGLFTHLLDIGASHAPMCHILTKPTVVATHDAHLSLVPLIRYRENTTVNVSTLDIVTLTVTTSHLVETFRHDTSVDNRIAILHYLLVHKGEFDSVAELISVLAERPLISSMTQVLQEFLVCGAYATVQRGLASDAAPLISLLPSSSSTGGRETETNVRNTCVRLTQELLWNTAMMLLSPQQRLVPYRADMWTRLWEHLARGGSTKSVFKPTQVTEKLMISLVCYQPEALSRCSTPLSPGGPLIGSASFSELSAMTTQSRKGDSLPFYEIESCTASKQEHVISVNLRELSMHLLKQSTGGTGSRAQWQPQMPMHVHAIATRYVSAQLDVSRQLCQLLCTSAGLDARHDADKGFALVNQLSDGKRYVLFTLLERYYTAVDSIAFPLPQGFTSFFTFLGYRILPFSMFMQYVKRNVFELQVDVMKTIMADIDDTKEGVLKKLKLLSVLPRSRAKRLLNQWCHPISLMLRAREHAFNILSGVQGQQPRVHALQKTRAAQLGLAAFPSAERLSPLDTFLDLLTAKASLAELDFALLIEATITSIDNFLV